MTHSKRILISGYYGFSNAGDEAVLSAIVRGLKSQANVDITVLSASPEETARVHGVRALPRMSLSQVTRALKDCDLFISGGGSLIQDATSLRSLTYYLAVISLAKRYRRKVMILGQGIGPLRRSISRRLVKKALTGVGLITVRDAQSAELLASMGIGPVKVTADPTFMLEPCADEESDRLLGEVGLRADDNIVAVSLRRLRFLQRGPDPVESDITEALRTLAGELPAKLMLVGMQSPDDLIMAREIGEKIGVPFQTSPWTAEEFLGVISRCRLVVGMRLHSLIFGAAVGIPCFGMIYDPKVESFLAATGQLGMNLEEVICGYMAEWVRNAWNARDELASNLSELVPPMKKAASENMRLAVELLAGQEG